MASTIKLYALSTCPHCSQAGELLEALVGPDGFEHIYVDRLFGDKRNDTMRELRTINPEMSFPTLIIDGEVITGFKEKRIRKLLKKTD